MVEGLWSSVICFYSLVQSLVSIIASTPQNFNPTSLKPSLQYDGDSVTVLLRPNNTIDWTLSIHLCRMRWLQDVIRKWDKKCMWNPEYFEFWKFDRGIWHKSSVEWHFLYLFKKFFLSEKIVIIKYEYTFLYLVWVRFSGKIDFYKVSYLHNTSFEFE